MYFLILAYLENGLQTEEFSQVDLFNGYFSNPVFQPLKRFSRKKSLLNLFKVS